MAQAQAGYSQDVTSTLSSEEQQLDAAVKAVKEKAREFARLGLQEKIRLIRESMALLKDLAPVWVAEGCKAKGLSVTDAGELWLNGPMPTMRHMRLLCESLEAIAQKGKPPLGTGTRRGPGGRLCIDQLPASLIDKITLMGFHGYALMEAGMDRERARRAQASFYAQRDPEGQVSLILGAGNVESIPPMDALTKWFNEGSVCVIKMNPVNEWVGPILERIYHPFVRRGYLRVVYGGAAAGKYLCEHPEVDDIHITGSDKTHDVIVWGPPGPERDRRMAEDRPVLQKPITSELGNVSPVAVVPYDYSDDELWFMARNVASMVTNNASFNCNAAKMLITAGPWRQRSTFLDLIARALASAPTRKAYYPGARDRYEALTRGREVQTFGAATGDKLPWTFIRGIDASADDDLFRTEPFCGILSETTLPDGDPAGFLAQATDFMNDRLWGTLNSMLIVHPKLEKSSVSQAVDRAIVDLRYGTVAINHWPAVCYATGTMAWGGHPSATLKDIQSGLGWVHNSFMLEGIEKSVVRGPLVMKPTPPWFLDNKKTATIAEKMFHMESSPSLFKLPGLILAAL